MDSSEKKKLAFVFARGGSKGVPRKNVKDLAGKPLLSYSIATANALPSIEGIYVSTEDTEIGKVAEEFGASVINRPEQLATDSSAEWDSWQHAVQQLIAENKMSSVDTFISLPTTSPLRSAQDIDACLTMFDSGGFDIVVTVTPAARSPYFNMVTFSEDNSVEIVMSNKGVFTRRQDCPDVFDMTTVCYVTSADFILKSKGVFDGKVGAVVVPAERAVDIDTLLDFKFAEFLIQHT